MKQLGLLLFCLMILIVFTSCGDEKTNQNSFEIYLVSGELLDNKNNDINKLTLEKTPILTLNDIQKYYWDKQVFITQKDLIRERIEQTGSYVGVYGLPYVVVVNGERIYMGKFWTGLSSVWAYSPSIMVDMAFVDLEQYDLQSDQQLYVVYWGSGDADTKEIVFDERIYNILKRNNLLSN